MRVNGKYDYMERGWLFPPESGENAFYIVHIDDSIEENFPWAVLTLGDGTEQWSMSGGIEDEKEYGDLLAALTRLDAVINNLILEMGNSRAKFLSKSEEQ